MTALNFMLSKDTVCITMDTLCQDPSDRSPFLYTSKIYPLPHLDGVMCGTGVAQFIVEWFERIQTGILAKNIEHLNEYVPGALLGLFEKYKKIDEKTTSTIYHFGYSGERREFFGFVYPSTSEFTSETMQEGCGYKPLPDSLVRGEQPEIHEFPADFIKVMEQQKIEDESRDNNSRVGVGGDIHCFYMRTNEQSEDGLPIIMTLMRCHRFPDYESMYYQMCMKLPANQFFRRS
jgi:hypothetical protein